MAAALTLVSEVSGVSWARGLDGAECVWIGRGANRAVLHERATETYLLHVRAPEPTRLRLESWFGGRRSADWGPLAIAWGEGVCGGANGTHLFVETEEGWVLREAGTPFVEGPLPERFVPLSGPRPCGLWKEGTSHRVGALNGSTVAVGQTQPLESRCLRDLRLAGVEGQKPLALTGRKSPAQPQMPLRHRHGSVRDRQNLNGPARRVQREPGHEVRQDHR